VTKIDDIKQRLAAMERNFAGYCYRPYSCEESERTKSLTMDKRHHPQYDQEKGLKVSPTSNLREKFKVMCAKVKHILCESREKLFSSLESDIKHNPKRFWSLLKHTSQTH
jgi:hypothetical protein